MHLTFVRAVSFPEPGRAELLLRPDIWAARQRRPTHQRFIVRLRVSENVETPQPASSA